MKISFDKNSAKFSINHQKIILALIILNEQLKIIFNNAVQNNSILFHH